MSETDADGAGWRQAWNEMTAPGGTLGPGGSTADGYVISEDMPGVVILLRPDAAAALARKLRETGVGVKVIIVTGETKEECTEAASHFPPGLNVKQVQASLQPGDAEAMLHSVAQVQARLDAYISRTREQLAREQAALPDIEYGWTENALPDSLLRRAKRRR